MGPRLFSRGNGDQQDGCREPGSASMGPRLFSRGNLVVHVGLAVPSRASMGPRLFSRGNVGCFGDGGTGDLGLQWGRDFSAAEITSSTPPIAGPSAASMGPRLFSRGNSTGWQATPTARGRFNGAATFQPRKYSPLPRADPLHRSFNGAATFQPRKCQPAVCVRAVRLTLQWGRDFSAAEIGIVNASGDTGTPASMGPRLFSRGNQRQ